MIKKSKWIWMILALIAFSGIAFKLLPKESAITSSKLPINQSNVSSVENLKAFAKLYGYIQYFHPSNEASEVDWNSFAIYGVQEVMNAKSSTELKERLQELFYPIAPTIQIYDKNEKLDKRSPVKNGKLIAWQHFGLGIDTFPNSGYKSERIISDHPSEIKLFDKTLPAMTAIDKSIHPDINVHIPIVLYTDGSETSGGTENSKKDFEKLEERLSDIDFDEKEKFLGNTVIAWNVFQHFYVYMDVLGINWEAELEKTLINIIDSKQQKEYEKSFQHLLVALGDGHISALYPQKNNFLPINMDWIENQLVVTSSETPEIQIGDIITNINGTQADSYISQLENEISGSKQWKRFKAIQEILSSVSFETKINFDLNRNGKAINDIFLTYNSYLLDDFNRFEKEPLYEIEDGIYYLNLTQLSDSEFQNQIESLSKAKGIIFDLRGYAEDFALSVNVISHLTDTIVKTPLIEIPKIIFPDQQNIEFENVQWEIKPTSPKFSGKIVYLTYGGAISRPELFLDIVKHYKLGEIVGQPTAGANGGVNMTQLIDSNVIYWTGARVRKHDGGQHHLIGVEPTITIERTIESVIQGRDEYIEKAIEMIHTK